MKSWQKLILFLLACVAVMLCAWLVLSALNLRAVAAQPTPFHTATRTPFQPRPTFPVTFTPTTTFTPTHTLTPSPSITFTPTATFTPSLTPTPTNTPLPEAVYMHGITGQMQTYNLDCESRSAVDLASYLGVSIDETEFLLGLPLSDDPDEGFVGSYNGPHGLIPPDSYGVHAEPVARRLRAYGLPAEAVRPFTVEGIKQELANGRPVMVWVIGPVWPGSGVSYTAPSTGHTSQVAYYEHTVLVIGYGPDYFTLLDGNVTYWRTPQTFLSSWEAMNNMAIIVKP